MSFLTSMLTAQSRVLHDGLIKLSAQHLPDLTTEAQLIEWDNYASQKAAIASHAATEAKTATDEVATLTSNVARFTAAAEHLAASNETAAADALSKAEGFQSQLTAAQANATDATSWANEARQSAEAAQQMAIDGRAKLDAAKRDQSRAVDRAATAKNRLADQQRMAGIGSSTNGLNAALDAMAENTRQANEAADAARLRSGVISKVSSSDDAIAKALEEVDHGAKPTSIADRIAALKAAK